ncbi:MAG: hypothetical protein NT069_24760 [Planctomycetota bacterium]|nr:hypothetical protein [Planctomycetota bacterium]
MKLCQHRSFFTVAALTTLLGVGLMCPAARAGVIVANAGFESPATPASNSSGYSRPSIAEQGGTGWSFTTFAGISTEGGDFFGGVVFPAPE